MRTPLQGGLLPAGEVTGPVVRIACDESGFSGTNLLHPGMPVITHASVDLTRDEAGDVIATLRSGRFSAHELKSGQFLRTGKAVDWFVSALRGRAFVQVVDKEFFLATRVVDLLLGEPSYASGTRLAGESRAAAVALYRSGRAHTGEWHAFLAAFTELVKGKRRRPADVTVPSFLRAMDVLGAAALRAVTEQRVRGLVERLDQDDRSIPPPLEPLLPALAETVLTWSGGQRQVLVTHDEQSALTADRLLRLQAALTSGDGFSPLAGFVMADSRDDPRVQVADLLAGLARRGPIDESLLAPHPLRDEPGPTFVRVKAVRWVDVEWPGWAEVHLREADDSVAVIVDKAPVLTDDDDFFPGGAALPVDLDLRCVVIARTTTPGGNRVATIRLGIPLEDTGGRTTFEVRESELVQSSSG
ncbi:hypothetical protein KOI35_12050 [Actinoplanes bogorensis]|uniref:DUF3800 domain-containing protein n=1 Tax=Paractinoplanes bogorensis TaxID=1610840 RepID=A0ABS5YL86_9ACTN|nr:hypothetical protein [Actinoplanes bogorensis]MBU2664225.1 hypothetical protein [Actinoplanes bogorensis]